uniref:Uncharacterized protein n=1 Tax=Chromera velia CCMP2878 TaxID=1169474 RepID=A0A0G4ICX7_9ALVE|eukprot:Cvel_2317.t1-p1 / transcript=Cvel_2317.t1 / gene=Cvel_2317 / organism=Chromera_velia_CCMP2878 / gene_product=hypothetical protein / transcript_product=hypothetical protein / location=Cvel_scaffold89:112036-113306(+) / protein_length=234 / sequence_SO=supercontig / SO=protein_coding / is_pseudo=false
MTDSETMDQHGLSWELNLSEAQTCFGCGREEVGLMMCKCKACGYSLCVDCIGCTPNVGASSVRLRTEELIEFLAQRCWIVGDVNLPGVAKESLEKHFETEDGVHQTERAVVERTLWESVLWRIRFFSHREDHQEKMEVQTVGHAAFKLLDVMKDDMGLEAPPELFSGGGEGEGEGSPTTAGDAEGSPVSVPVEADKEEQGQGQGPVEGADGNSGEAKPVTDSDNAPSCGTCRCM